MSKDKQLTYQIQIHLYTDGDFAFRKEMLPPDFFNDDSREIIICSEEDFVCNIYEKDMSHCKWNHGEWSMYEARSTFEQYISAIHVSHTHLYIWEDLLECLKKLERWIYHRKTFENKDYFTAYMYGNYLGTEFTITSIKEYN